MDGGDSELWKAVAAMAAMLTGAVATLWRVITRKDGTIAKLHKECADEVKDLNEKRLEAERRNATRLYALLQQAQENEAAANDALEALGDSFPPPKRRS